MKHHLPLILTLVLLIAVGAAASAAPLSASCVAGAVYNPACDVDHDGDVDILDIQLTAGHWSQSGPYVNDGWSLTGNAGTIAGVNFLGTTDAQALELKVNGQRALRLEPTGDSPNVIGGSFANLTTVAVYGATIAGGGGDLVFNRVTDSYGAIGGGYANTAGDNAGTINDRTFATVGGGGGNSASGWRSTVGGGWYNVASGESSTVGGGHVNQASGLGAAIGGGHSNMASTSYSTVAGGDNNQVAGTGGTVGGGASNWASTYAVVAGGRDNTANPYGIVPGGQFNFAGGSYSLAAGRRAKAYYDGDFVWADSTDADFGAAAANQFIVRASGGVGLGTNAPDNQLHVTEAINASATPANHVAQIENTSTGNSGDVLALKIGYTGNPLSSSNFITFFKGDDASAGAVEGNGSGGVVLAGPGSLIVLWLPQLDPAESLQPGDVVGLFAGHVSRRTTGAEQLLVVGQNAIVAAGAPAQDQREGYAMVALAGLAAVRVSGPAAVGDLIVPSGRDDGSGVAVAASEFTPTLAGQVIGQAWQASTSEGETTIKVAVGSFQVNAVVNRLAGKLAELQAQITGMEARLSALERARLPGQ